MKIIGLTGRSGCGKSTVAKYFREQGLTVADADLAARKALQKGSLCIPLLQEKFGYDIVDVQGNVKRRLLADRAFAQESGSQSLIQITHAEIVRLLLEDAAKAQEAGEALFIVDGAVIVDAPFEKYCDEIILITAPKEISIQRICKRDKISPESAAMRLDAQTSENRLRQSAKYVIQNNGSREELLKKAEDLLAKLKGGVA